MDTDNDYERIPSAEEAGRRPEASKDDDYVGFQQQADDASDGLAFVEDASSAQLQDGAANGSASSSMTAASIDSEGNYSDFMNDYVYVPSMEKFPRPEELQDLFNFEFNKKGSFNSPNRESEVEHYNKS